MFLSHLLVNTAASAGGGSPGRHWVGNPYRVHQRLWMAFPSATRTKLDEDFLDPFLPEQFQPLSRVGCEVAGRTDTPKRGEKRKPHPANAEHRHLVHDERAGFLFRIDPVPFSSPGRHVITVQSATRPDWGYAFANAPEFLDVPEYGGENPRVTEYLPDYHAGQTLRFRLRANPTKQIRPSSFRADTSEKRPHWMLPYKERHGKKVVRSRRVGITDPVEQSAWLSGKAAKGGFTIIDLSKAEAEGTDPAWKAGWKVEKDHEQWKARAVAMHDGPPPSPKELDAKKRSAMALVSVFFEGHLEVTDPTAFAATLAAGVGSAKGMGFGLLSLAAVG